MSDAAGDRNAPWPSRMLGARNHALGVLSNMAEDGVTELANKLFNEGKAAWVWDPMHESVVGLVKAGTRNDAYIVVYLATPDQPDDFELSDDFEEML